MGALFSESPGACNGYESERYFFDTQFQKQIVSSDFSLNPFEQAVLPFVHGRVLDLGCGLGNLSAQAASNGAEVVAVDASETSIRQIQDTVAAQGLKIEAVLADISTYAIPGKFDTIVAIGLLMFFERARALALRDVARPALIDNTAPFTRSRRGYATIRIAE